METVEIIEHEEDDNMEELWACLFVIGLMTMDVITGYAQAVKNGSVSSSVMREGLFKKAGSIAVIILAVAVGHVGAYVGIDGRVCSAVAGFVIGMVAVMEITSVIENACSLNPDLPVAKLFSAFGVDKDD